MIDKLIDLDKRLLLFLNGFHSPTLDPVMRMITETVFWIPLYLILIFLIFKNFKREGWFILAGAAITILLCDQITSTFMKPYFERLRPSHDPTLSGLLHLVNNYQGGSYKGGLYGFASSHAANTFGTALFVWLTLRSVYSWLWVIFIWAALMTYTRIYLGVHFPGDILVGAMVGLICGWIGYIISNKLRRRNKKLHPLQDGV